MAALFRCPDLLFHGVVAELPLGVPKIRNIGRGWASLPWHWLVVGEEDIDCLRGVFLSEWVESTTRSWLCRGGPARV